MSLKKVYSENNVYCFRLSQSDTAWINKSKKAITLGRHVACDKSGYRKARNEWIQLKWKEFEQLNNKIQNRLFSSAMATACFTGQRHTLFLADENANLKDIELSFHPTYGRVNGIRQDGVIVKMSYATFLRLYKEL